MEFPPRKSGNSPSFFPRSKLFPGQNKISLPDNSNVKVVVPASPVQSQQLPTMNTTFKTEPELSNTSQQVSQQSSGFVPQQQPQYSTVQSMTNQQPSGFVPQPQYSAVQPMTNQQPSGFVPQQTQSSPVQSQRSSSFVPQPHPQYSSVQPPSQPSASFVPQHSTVQPMTNTNQQVTQTQQSASFVPQNQTQYSSVQPPSQSSASFVPQNQTQYSSVQPPSQQSASFVPQTQQVIQQVTSPSYVPPSSQQSTSSYVPPSVPSQPIASQQPQYSPNQSTTSPIIPQTNPQSKIPLLIQDQQISNPMQSSQSIFSPQLQQQVTSPLPQSIGFSPQSQISPSNTNSYQQSQIVSPIHQSYSQNSTTIPSQNSNNNKSVNLLPVLENPESQLEEEKNSVVQEESITNPNIVSEARDVREIEEVREVREIGEVRKNGPVINRGSINFNREQNSHLINRGQNNSNINPNLHREQFNPNINPNVNSNPNISSKPNPNAVQLHWTKSNVPGTSFKETSTSSAIFYNDEQNTSNSISPPTSIPSSLLATPELPGKLLHFPDFKQRSIISFLPSEEKHSMRLNIFYEVDNKKTFYIDCLNYDQDKIRNELNSCLTYLAKKTGLTNLDQFKQLSPNPVPKNNSNSKDKTEEKKTGLNNSDQFKQSNKDKTKEKKEGIVIDENGNTLLFYKSRKELNMKYTDNNQYETVEGGLMFIVGSNTLQGDGGKLLPGSILLFGNYFIPSLQKQIYFRSSNAISTTENTISAFLSIMIDRGTNDKDSEWALQSRTYFKSRNSGRRGYLMHSIITY